MDALTLMNRDCWKEVFVRLNAKDKVNFSLVCSTFERILLEDENENEWMFSLILPHLLKYLPVNQENQRCDWSSLFNCRRTCKSWLKAVDNYLENNPDLSMFSNDEIYPPVCYYFHRERYIIKFQEEFKDYKKLNPFVGRQVVLDRDGEGGTGRQASLVLKQIELMEQFGEHVFTLSISEFFSSLHVHSSDIILSSCCSVQQLLCHTPNLRYLQLTSAGPCQSHGMIQKYLEEHPLPPLPFLEWFSGGEICQTMENAVIEKYSPQLKCLILKEGRTLSPSQVGGFQNLTRLIIYALNSDDNLKVLGSLKSPLENLKVNLAFETEEYATWRIDQFFANVCHLPLKKVKIEIDTKVNLSECPLKSTEYSQNTITSISVSCYNKKLCISWNFLEHLKALKILKIRYFTYGKRRSKHPPNVTEHIKLHPYLHSLEDKNMPYQSNLWSKVPTLNILKWYWAYGPEVIGQRYLTYIDAEYRRDEWNKMFKS